MSTVKRECQVVMLPTQKDSPISLEKDGAMRLKFIGTMDNGYINTSTQQNQHIYILSDDEIKEGDWIYWNNKIFKAIDTVYTNSTKKIIATTDSSLEVVSTGINPVYEKLAQLPEDFIEDFIIRFNNWNQIEKVMVDYVEYQNLSFPVTKIHDNTITISKLKDSWSREEVKDLIKKFINDSKPNSEFFKKYGDIPGGIPALREKWMDEHI